MSFSRKMVGLFVLRTENHQRILSIVLRFVLMDQESYPHLIF